MKKGAYILFSFLIYSCDLQNNKETFFEPALAALTVNNLDVSTNWYSKLGFGLDTTMSFLDYGLRMNFLELGSFKLELIEFEEKVSFDRGQLPENANVLGFIKLGFLTPDLNVISQSMLKMEADIIAGPSSLPPLESKNAWPNRFLLVKDPDGNYIQFFECNVDQKQNFEFAGDMKLAPFLAMIAVEKFDESQSFYESLDFIEIEKIIQPGNERGLFKRLDFVLEIGSFDGDKSLQSLGVNMDKVDKVVRINKLGFRYSETTKLYQEARGKGRSIYYDGMADENPNFILEDNAGNYLQFFSR